MGDKEALAAASSPGSQRLRFDILCESTGGVAQAMEMDAVLNNWTLTCVTKSQLTRDVSLILSFTSHIFLSNTTPFS